VNTIVTTPNTAKSSVGHVAVRASGHFNGQTAQNLAQGISRRYCKLISRADGEGYSITQVALQKGGAGMERAHPAALSLPGMNAGVSRAT
jgi:hypothetical protein